MPPKRIVDSLHAAGIPNNITWVLTPVCTYWSHNHPASAVRGFGAPLLVFCWWARPSCAPRSGPSLDHKEVAINAVNHDTLRSLYRITQHCTGRRLMSELRRTADSKSAHVQVGIWRCLKKKHTKQRKVDFLKNVIYAPSFLQRLFYNIEPLRISAYVHVII